MLSEELAQQSMHHGMQASLGELVKAGLRFPDVDVAQPAPRDFKGDVRDHPRWRLWAEAIFDASIERCVDWHVLGERVCHIGPR